MAQPSTRSDAASAAPVPATIDVNSPEFKAAVAATVAETVARVLEDFNIPPHALEEPTIVGVPQPVVIQPTSIDTSKPGPDDLTVQFSRFCTFQNCGYQRGQQAGFPRKAAEDLQRAGAAVIVWDPRIHEQRYARRAA